MGEGEGAQAYGWGTYVTEVEGIGRTYAERGRKDVPEFVYNDKEVDFSHLAAELSDIAGEENDNVLNHFLLEWDRNGSKRAKEYLAYEIRDAKDLRNHSSNPGAYDERIAGLEALSKVKGIRKNTKVNKTSFYTVEIPDDTGENYLDWDKPLPERIDKGRIKGRMLEETRSGDEIENELLERDISSSLEDAADGESLYKAMKDYIGGKGASMLLHDLGYVGIRYPAEYRSGGRRDGAKNYVIFDEKDLQITDHVRFRDGAEAQEPEETNARFNGQLAGLTEENADRTNFNLGNPSEKLLSAGIADKPIRLHGSKVIKKMKKHGFALEELRDLPRAVANPIAVFDNLGKEGNRSVLTELKTANGNFLVTIDLGKGTEADFDIVNSVFGKKGNSVVAWINKGYMRYVDKEKALNYLHLSAPIAEASDNAELSSAAKVVENFENPKMPGENVAEDDKTKFRLLEDDDPKAQELEALPDSELVPVYRNVQAFEDDALGSPMAFTDAETGERRTLQGQKWNYSNPPQIELTPEQQRQLDELNKNGYIMVDGKKTTELQINDGLKFVKPKTKDAQLQYFLKKNPEDKGLWAAYDPYDHAIETPLNTQFGEAYKRPNLVVVRSLIPKSEIDEPFHADYALLPTGAHQWNNGRTLYLSRWSKIDKVLTREEEAKLIDEYWKKHPGKREELKTHRDYNRFVPQVRRELEKMGYRFELNGKELTPEESLALDKQNWENRDVIPGREGNVPFVSNEDIKRINAKMGGKWVGEPKEVMENAMTERVNELADRLHTPVRIIRTDEEIAALPSARQRRMKGSFNPMTGEVTIVVPNNANMADVENTFIHEVVGHDGLRVLFPTEEKLNNALDELYRVSKDGIQDTIDCMARKMYDAEVDRLMRSKRREHEASGGNADAHYFTDLAEAHVEADRKCEQFKRDATEEYGADLAGRIGEKGFEKMSAEELTFWGKLKSMLQNALRKLAEGLGIPGVRKWGDNEWAFVLHEAYKRKRNGGRPSVADAADTVSARESTGFDGELYRVGDVKAFRDGSGIEFRRKPTATFNALLAHLEKEGVKAERHKARTGSEYASFSRYGVMYEVRNADHTKAMSADRRAEESGVEVTDWDGMIRHIDMDLVQARMNAADVYALMDEAERFNSEDEAVRRAATEDGVGSAEFRDAYPTLWRVMGLKSPEEARMEHLRKKYADEYYTARGKELDKLYPFTASNGVTIGRGRKFRVPKSIVYGKGDARRAAEEEFDKAYKKVYDEFIPLDDFVRQREQEGNLDEVNRRFNEQLQLYRNGEMDKNEMLRLGRPQGVMRAFLPNLPIVMRQRILTKGSVRKHNVSVEALANMPKHLAHPIFVFKRSDNALGVLTEMQDRDGKNICVAIELNRQIQNGGEILEVNDIRSVHGRNVSDIVYPIVQNGTLEWADKKKGLAYLSSASRYVRQEIDRQDLDTAAKVVENFENPKVSDEKASDEDLMFRDGDAKDYEKAQARDRYERRVRSGLFQSREALQDSMLSLKVAMDEIEKAASGKGKHIEDYDGYENAYLGENRLSSVNPREVAAFTQLHIVPMLKEVNHLAPTAKERAELVDYMFAKHGLERNEYMRQREAEKKYDTHKKKHPDSSKTVADFTDESHDYAGLTALTGKDDVLAAETDAQRMVAEYEKDYTFHGTWNEIYVCRKKIC